MKILIIFMFLPFAVFAQADKIKDTLSYGVLDSVYGTSIVIKYSAVIFEKKYSSKLTQKALRDGLESFLKSLPNFKFSDTNLQSFDKIRGDLTNLMIDFRLYGGSNLGTALILNHPLSANVFILVNDYSYTVTISNITFNKVKVLKDYVGSDYKFDDYLTTDYCTKIKNGKQYIKSAKYVDQSFSQYFLFGSD